ncbi:unnamed protein product [Cochlearia groenlandica]
MSSVCGKFDYKVADFANSALSPRLCSNGSENSSYSGSEDSQESSDGDETGYIDQTANEEDTSEEDLVSLSPKSLDDEDKDENFTTLSQPKTPVVLIPAIKGSREKHGLSLKKSNVSWADDVYDPPPSLASHTRNKKHQHKSKSKDSHHRKTGKKGHKSKDNSSSRSGKDKDKKQSPRKHSREKFDWVTQMPIAAASS